MICITVSLCNNIFVDLQKKGLILIQLLADKKMCRDREICSGLADTLYKSLVTHSDNNGVLKEVFPISYSCK